MTATGIGSTLTRRERQVMDALYRLQRATVSDILDEMPEQATYDAVRAVLRTLEQKGLVRHRPSGPRYVYSPSVPTSRARRRALDHLVRTFFDGSAEDAAAALLGMAELELSDDALARLAAKIREAQREGR